MQIGKGFPESLKGLFQFGGKMRTCMRRLWPVAGVNAGILWYVGRLIVMSMVSC